MRSIPILLTAIITAFILASTANAQDVDPCDINPDAPECNVPAISIVDAGPACPYGGWVIVFFGEPSPPLCWPAPPAPTAAVPAPVAPAPVTQVIQQVINNPVISPVQPPGCLSRRRFDVSIPQRFRWGTRVQVIVGGERQWDDGVASTFVRQNHRIRVDLRARPCGVYAVIVKKRRTRPSVRLYTAGPNGNMTGFNIAAARARG